MPDSENQSVNVDVTANFSAINVDLSPIAEFDGTFRNLIETLARGCGRMYRPLERILNAKADKIVALERADQSFELGKRSVALAKLLSSSEVPLNQLYFDDPSLLRFTTDLHRRQTNREAIAGEMILELSSREILTDSERNIDLDWVDDFFDIAEKISNNEVREFWAKLLATEIVMPGAICRQTLHVLRAISANTAKRFSHFCRTSIMSGRDIFVVHPHVFDFQNVGPLDEYDIQIDDLFDFESAGLIRSAETLMVNYSRDREQLEQIELGGRQAEIQWASNQVHLIKFTIAGSEIRNSLPLTPLENYAQALREYHAGKLRFSWIN